jgi:hydrogenase expression/formation protein HypE
MAITQPAVSCPIPTPTTPDRVMLAHGEGGRLMRQLIRQHVLPELDNEFLREIGDAAMLPACTGPLAMTTDCFVVSPLFFPGGDIG